MSPIVAMESHADEEDDPHGHLLADSVGTTEDAVASSSHGVDAEIPVASATPITVRISVLEAAPSTEEQAAPELLPYVQLLSESDSWQQQQQQQEHQNDQAQQNDQDDKEPTRTAAEEGDDEPLSRGTMAEPPMLHRPSSRNSQRSSTSSGGNPPETQASRVAAAVVSSAPSPKHGLRRSIIWADHHQSSVACRDDEQLAATVAVTSVAAAKHGLGRKSDASNSNSGVPVVSFNNASDMEGASEHSSIAGGMPSVRDTSTANLNAGTTAMRWYNMDAANVQPVSNSTITPLPSENNLNIHNTLSITGQESTPEREEPSVQSPTCTTTDQEESAPSVTKEKTASKISKRCWILILLVLVFFATLLAIVITLATTGSGNEDTAALSSTTHQESASDRTTAATPNDNSPALSPPTPTLTPATTTQQPTTTGPPTTPKPTPHPPGTATVLSTKIIPETVELFGITYTVADTIKIDRESAGIQGTIPTTLGFLTELQHLNLISNQLTGQIPSEIGLLTSLTWLYLWSNQLSGEIPSEIGLLTNVWYMGLSKNQLWGSIPQSLCHDDKGDGSSSGTAEYLLFEIDCPAVTCDCNACLCGVL